MTEAVGTTDRRRVAIVGAGLSGLSTAVKLHLADPSIELTLLEASDRVGGVIHSESVGEFLIDHGADMFATEPQGVIELCRQVGIDDRLIEPNVKGRGARIVSGRRLVPVPEGFVVMRSTRLIPMLTTPLLSVRGKIRFLRERWIKPSREQDESIGSFVRRRMGAQVLDRIVAPLAAGIYTGDIDRLSMRATMGPVAEMERQHGSLAKASSVAKKSKQNQVSERHSAGARYDRFRSFAGGMVELIQGLANALPAESIRLHAPVYGMERIGDRIRVSITLKNRDTESAEFDHVVVTTPSAISATLIGGLAPVAADELKAIEATSTAIVVLGVRQSDIREDINTFGFVVPAAENRKILAGSFSSNKFAGRAPDGCVLIRCFIGGALQSELLARSDDELIEIARTELAELIGLSGKPIAKRVVRWNSAMPQYNVGHLDRANKIQEEIASVPGLSLVTNAVGGVGIASVVRSADQVAKNVVASFTASTSPNQ